MQSNYAKEISSRVPTIFLMASSVFLLFTIIALSTDRWVRVESGSKEEFVGLFYSKFLVIYTGNTMLLFLDCETIIHALCKTNFSFFSFVYVLLQVTIRRWQF